MRYLVLAVAMIVSTTMVACGKKSSSTAYNNNNFAVGGCGTGYYNYGGNCQVAPMGGLYHQGALRFGGSINHIGSQAFAQMLGQYGRFCANNGWNNWPGTFNYNIAFGSANCRSYAQAGYVKIIFDYTGTRAQVVVGSGTSNGHSPYEVVFNSRVYRVNNSAGMEIRGFGRPQSGGWNAVYDQALVIRVQQGTPANHEFTAELEYRGQRIGEAQVYRY